MTLDDVLDKIEDRTVNHPTPLAKSHCDYCSAWLVIMEDILEVGDN